MKTEGVWLWAVGVLATVGYLVAAAKNTDTSRPIYPRPRPAQARRRHLVAHRDDPGTRRFYDLCFVKPPAEELYSVADDPDQLVNLAGREACRDVLSTLSARLTAALKAAADPRETGGPITFDDYPYRARYSRGK